MGNSNCFYDEMIRWGKEIAMSVVLCAFMAFLCWMFIVFGIVWSLADYAVRKLEKGGCL